MNAVALRVGGVPDTVEIRRRFKDSGRQITAWALAKNFNPSTTWKLIHGQYASPKGKTAVAIRQALEADGLWAEPHQFSEKR